MRFKDFYNSYIVEEATPAPSPSNINASYTVGKVAFDNVHGLGAVPNNQEVKYLGFAAMLTPAQFLSLAARDNRDQAAEQIAELISKGRAIGAPFLSISFDPNAFMKGQPIQIKVVGHEGRARTQAIAKINGDTPKFPVHFFLSNGIRAHNLSPEFFSTLRNQGIIPEKGALAEKLQLGQIFWTGQIL